MIDEAAPRFGRRYDRAYRHATAHALCVACVVLADFDRLFPIAIRATRNA